METTTYAHQLALSPLCELCLKRMRLVCFSNGCEKIVRQWQLFLKPDIPCTVAHWSVVRLFECLVIQPNFASLPSKLVTTTAHQVAFSALCVLCLKCMRLICFSNGSEKIVLQWQLFLKPNIPPTVAHLECCEAHLSYPVIQRQSRECT